MSYKIGLAGYQIPENRLIIYAGYPTDYWIFGRILKMADIQHNNPTFILFIEVQLFYNRGMSFCLFIEVQLFYNYGMSFCLFILPYRN